MTQDTFSLDAWMRPLQNRIESVLSQHIPEPSTLPSRLHEAMRYATLGGGKRIRALLAYASGELCHAELSAVDFPAAAVEMIHAYSLIHDDMPCMDDDDMRRGKPSTHKQFDDATALLAGDALQSQAFLILSDPVFSTHPTSKLTIINILAKAIGSMGMAGGQSIDLQSTGKSLTQQSLEQMHQLKTGALIHASVMMGAYCAPKADADILDSLATYTHSIGLAFQVIDDILDVESSSTVLGKTAGKDASDNKTTYVSLLGLDQAKALSESLYQTALFALEPYGNEANALRGLAKWIVKRHY